MDEIEESSRRELGNDLLEKIFLLPSLPVKSLIRFKSVCKQWRDLISDPTFAKLHLDVAHDSRHNVSQIHMCGYNTRSYVPDEDDDGKFQPLFQPEQRERPWSVSFSPVDSEIDVVQLGQPVEDVPLQVLDVYGSCHGLLLIASYDKSFLWNPTIREHVELRVKPYIWDVEPYFRRRFTGLGYNSVLDEYKAVVFYVAFDLAKVERKMTQVYIYSSRIGYWKEVYLDFPYNSLHYYTNGITMNGITVNGYPHWVVNEDNGNMYSNIIIFFDTGNDTFRVLPAPIEWGKNGSSLVSTWGGCLCACQLNFPGRNYEIWIMKDYGVVESWTKLLIIPLFPKYFSYRPLGFINNGDEVVIEVNYKSIVTYNLRTNEENFVVGTAYNHFYNCGLRSFGYLQSLISPCNLRK